MFGHSQMAPLRYALLQGVLFSFLWGVLMWFCHWQNQAYMSPLAAVVTSVLAGGGFGYAMLRIRQHQIVTYTKKDWPTD